MQKYARLSDAGSLHDGSLPEFSPPFATEYELNPTTRWGKVCSYSASFSSLNMVMTVEEAFGSDLLLECKLKERN